MVAKRSLRLNDCAFCNYRGPSPILLQLPGAIVFEPLNPVVAGHLLVVSRKHVESLADDGGAAASMGAAVSRAVDEFCLRGRCNVIVNDGALAGQTVFHLHAHLVPRRRGDGLKLPWS